MMEVCPKCLIKGIHFDADPGYERNVCYSCGWSHTPRSFLQSFERQVKGDNVVNGIGLPDVIYDESSKGIDSTYDVYNGKAVYHYNKALNERNDMEKEKSIELGKRLFTAMNKMP